MVTCTDLGASMHTQTYMRETKIEPVIELSKSLQSKWPSHTEFKR